MERHIKLTPLGKHLVGISIDNVSFVVWKEEAESILKKFQRREEGSIITISMKKISFTFSPQLNSFVVSDSHTGDYAVISVE